MKVLSRLRRSVVARAWLEPSSTAISLYRFTSRRWTSSSAPQRVLGRIVHYALFPLIEGWSGVTLPPQVIVGEDLQIHHRGKVVINPGVIIGARCSIVHGVTIGNREPGGGTPVLGDDVEIGAYAQVLGDIRIGSGARIGALAIVVDDVPAGAVVRGGKARIVSRQERTGSN